MGKVIYLLGAGASFGIKDNNGKRTHGVPVICEFAEEVANSMTWLRENFSKEVYEPFIKELSHLHSICVQYPTVDTYAKMLFATHNDKEYLWLSNIITIFLTLVQLQYPHDPRYDGWIASITDNEGFFPDNVSVLSWNYDAQLELAYRSYQPQSSLARLWKSMNVLNKSYVSKRPTDKFSVVKLNGTAFYHLDDGVSNGLLDMLITSTPTENVRMLAQQLPLHSNNVANELSYVWETRTHENFFLPMLMDIVRPADILVVIGYSFPFVNRGMDNRIFSNMPLLKKVYIQDINANHIIEIIKERKGFWNRNIQFVPINNVSQFFIPAEVDDL